MKTLMLVLLSSVLVVGCAFSSMGRVPVERTAFFPHLPPLVYGQARIALASLGAQVTHTDGSHLSGILKGVVLLNVEVTAQGTGSLVAATGQLLPGKVVIGDLDEVDAFIARLRERLAYAQ